MIFTRRTQRSRDRCEKNSEVQLHKVHEEQILYFQCFSDSVAIYFAILPFLISYICYTTTSYGKNNTPGAECEAVQGNVGNKAGSIGYGTWRRLEPAQGFVA